LNACERDTRNSVRIHTGFGGAIVITVEWWDDGESAYIGNSVTVTVAYLFSAVNSARSRVAAR
jgi:hypothetical protein